MSVTEYDYCPDCGHRVRIKSSKVSGRTVEYGKFFGLHFVRSYDYKHCPGSEKEVKHRATTQPQSVLDN